MGKKFTSFKRYGLEGAESALVALEEMLVQANRTGYEKVVIGMPHRGRLNMLVSLLDLPARALFAKVKGQSLVPEGMDAWDDVASHLAITTSKKFDRSASNPLTVSLLHNPSHLEAVNPVALGKTKAKQDDYPQKEGVEKVLSLQLHGDSAYAGQGIVPESLQMAYLTEFSVGYENTKQKQNKPKPQRIRAHERRCRRPPPLSRVFNVVSHVPLFGMCFLVLCLLFSGTVHMIVNNQLGFTTGGVGRNRSSRYSSDIGKIISMPVLHVNADAPESVAYAARMALAFQRHFHRDIMVDLIGYRKHGHNEVDEPSFTQPLMYKDIRSRANIVKLYRESLTKAGVFSEGTDPDAKLVARLTAHLEKELAEAPTYKAQQDEHFQGKWKGIGQPKDVEDGQQQERANSTASRCDWLLCASRAVQKSSQQRLLFSLPSMCFVFAVVKTGVDVAVLKQIGEDSVKLPEGFVSECR
jgi:2-oxoglutarate dehydrogenase E1 component